MMPVILGLSLPGVYALIMQSLCSYFHTGVNTYLNYSNKLMQAPLGVFGQSLAIGVFPALAQFYAQKRMDMFQAQLSSTLRTVIYLTLPCSVLLFMLAPQVVAALLQHGKFNPEDTLPTAAALRWFALGITAWCMHPVLMRGFFAAHMTVKPIVLGTLTTAVFFTLASFLWNNVPALDFLALPLAGSTSAIFLMCMLAVSVSKNVAPIDFSGLISTFVKSAIGCLGLAAVASLVTFTKINELSLHNKAVAFGSVGGVFLFGAWAYFLITKALGMPETSYVSRALNRKRSKAA